MKGTGYGYGYDGEIIKTPREKFFLTKGLLSKKKLYI